jgi:hypothetical protein
MKKMGMLACTFNWKKTHTRLLQCHILFPLHYTLRISPRPRHAHCKLPSRCVPMVLSTCFWFIPCCKCSQMIADSDHQRQREHQGVVELLNCRAAGRYRAASVRPVSSPTFQRRLSNDSTLPVSKYLSSLTFFLQLWSLVLLKVCLLYTLSL